MNICMLSRGNGAVKCFALFNHPRLYTTASKDSEPSRESFSGSPIRRVAAKDGTKQQAQEEQNDLSGPDGGRSVNGGAMGSQVSGDGQNEKSTLYKRRPLPLSPFMVPELVAARNKWLLPKPLPGIPTEHSFSAQLAKNPYALALATPVRKCQVTQTALPKYFLQDFNIMAHPITGDPYWLPYSLTSKLSAPDELRVSKADAFISEAEIQELEPSAEEEIKPAHQDESVAEIEPSAEEKPEPGYQDQSSTIISKMSTPKVTHKVGPNVYTLGRKLAITSMQMKSSGNMDKWKRFGGPRVRSYKNYGKVVSATSWRPDMDTFILELMRRRVTESLITIVKRKRGYVIPCADWEDAKSKPQAGALLWSGPTESEAKDECGPPEFATLVMGRQKKKKVPVHNLRVLLGYEHLERLKQSLPKLFDTGLLEVRHRGATIELQMKLWKLQGYIATFADEQDP